MVTDAAEAKRAEERAKAVRALLRTPLLTPVHGSFPAARRHADSIAAFFARETGWQLTHNATVVRLRKHGINDADHTRGAQIGGVSASRRRYVLVCLCLAVLERAEKQVTLGWLAERVLQQATDPKIVAAGIEFTLSDRAQRTDLAVVAKFLMVHGALTRVAGDEQAYVDTSGDVLYDVNRHVLASLLSNSRGPSTITTPDPARRRAAIAAEFVPEAEDARNRAIRHRISRRLLDDPVVYFAELTAEDLEYLNSQRGHILRRLTEFTGLLAEVRTEGIALLDPTGESSDYGMPEEGTDGHATLLVAEHLAERNRADPGRPLTVVELETYIARRAPEFTTWRKNARDPGAERDLVAQALHRLASLRLVRLTDTTVTVLPALARYAYADPIIQGEQS